MSFNFQFVLKTNVSALNLEKTNRLLPTQDFILLFFQTVLFAIPLYHIFFLGRAFLSVDFLNFRLVFCSLARASRSYDRASRSQSRYALKSSTCEQVYFERSFPAWLHSDRASFAVRACGNGHEIDSPACNCTCMQSTLTFLWPL